MTTATTEPKAPATAHAPKCEPDYRALIGQLSRKLTEWREEDGNDPPGSELFAINTDFVLNFEGRKLEPDDRRIITLAENNAKELIHHLDTHGRFFNKVHPLSAYIGTIEELERALESGAKAESCRPPLETIAQLLQQQVPDHQIAKIHGISVAQVYEAREFPERYSGPSYVPPVLVQKRKDELAEIAKQSVGIVLQACAIKLRAYREAGLI